MFRVQCSGFWVPGDCVIPCVESRCKRQIVDLLYGQHSTRRRHALSVGLPCSDPLTDINTYCLMLLKQSVIYGARSTGVGRTLRSRPSSLTHGIGRTVYSPTNQRSTASTHQRSTDPTRIPNPNFSIPNPQSTLTVRAYKNTPPVGTGCCCGSSRRAFGLRPCRSPRSPHPLPPLPHPARDGGVERG